MRLIKDLYAYREMIASLVRRDLRGRYKGSVLGFAWTFLNPIFQLAIYTMVFSVILRSGIEDYYLHLFVALVPWIFFSSCISAGAGCIRSQGDMIKKIYFPREVIPLSFVTSQFINMLLSMIIVFAAVLIGGKPMNIQAYLCLPLIMIVEYVMALGVTFLVSAISVFYKDVEYFMGIIAMAWQFMTPIMYGIEVVPQSYLPLLSLNPMTFVIVSYREILYYGRVPEVKTLMGAVIFGVLILFLGIKVFGKMQRHFAEEL